MEKISLDRKFDSNLQFDLYHSKTKEALGLIQISHGMAEHKARYVYFINYFNQHGYHVAIYDHRGHGERIIDGKIGFFNKDNGWELVVMDLINVHEETNRLFPKLPKILLGHSMGSWIALAALQKESFFNAALISGSNYPNISELMLKILLKFEILRLGEEGYSKLLHKIIFGGFNSRFKDTTTPNDWLTRDKLSVKNYTQDPLCGFIVSNKLLSDVIDGTEAVFKKPNLELLSTDIPLLIFFWYPRSCEQYGQGSDQIAWMLKKL